jgi:hypothetical protein
MADEVDTLAEQIVIDDSQALKSLADFATSLVTAQEKIQGLQTLVDAVANQMGGDFDAAKQKVMDFNEAIAAMPQITGGIQGFDPAIFEQVTNSLVSIEEGEAALARLPEPFIAAVPAAQQAEEAFQQDAEALNAIMDGDEKVEESFYNLGNAGQEAGQQIVQSEEEATAASGDLEKAVGRVGTAIQFAFGLGIYQIVRNFIDLIKQGVKDGIDFAQAMYLISTAVDQMRAAGIDVQFKDLSSIVTDLGPKLQAFSNLDLTKVTGEVAAIGGQFGITRDQVETLVEFSLVAQERLGTDAVTNANTLTAALLNITNARSAQILRNMGMEISAQDVYNEAVQLGIDNGAKTYKDLTDQEKIQAGIALIEQQRQNWQKWELDYLDNASGKVKTLGAAWENLWTGWGIAITNIMPKIVGMFDWVIYSLALISGNLQALIDLAEGKVKSLDDFMNDALNRTKEIYGLYTNPSPSSVAGAPGTSTTPLGAPPEIGGLSSADQIKIQTDATKEIVDLHDSEVAQLEKIDTDYWNKLLANQNKYNRAILAEDVQAANQRQKIADDTAETLLVDAEKKRLDDIEAEQKYQEELMQLRDQFELNLEDALRSRDAKSIIHLIEQYDLQKSEKAKQYDNETTIRNENYQQEIDLANQKEAFDLAQLQKTVDARKAALAVELDNENTDAAIARDNQITAEQTDIANRLKAWEDGLKLQYDITDAEMQNIYNNINAYLGKNGMVDAVYTYIIARMAQVYAALGGGYSGIGGGSSNPKSTPMASGGSLFANTPTNVTFGEAGPEVATFIPLGTGFNGVPSPSFAMAGAGGGSIQLQVTLDPNLEAQIVQTSLDNVALSIDRIQRQG